MGNDESALIGVAGVKLFLVRHIAPVDRFSSRSAREQNLAEINRSVQESSQPYFLARDLSRRPFLNRYPKSEIGNPSIPLPAAPIAGYGFLLWTPQKPDNGARLSQSEEKLFLSVNYLTLID
jgi:hypothetical protein